MESKWIIIAIVIGLILAIIAGIYAYNTGGISQTNIIVKEELAERVNEEKQIQKVNQTIETSAKEVKTSPNAIIIEKRYYKGCDHLTRDEKDISEEMVNKTEEEIERQYPGWKLESYSPTEIILYKETNGFCDEHYVAREHNGYIGIYNINEQGVEKLKEDTEIATAYLPEEDLERLKIGVPIVGKRNLYNFLEDYE